MAAGEAGHVATVQIGNVTTHQSHTLAWKRGIWFCVKCGAYAKAAGNHRSTCRHLAAECKEPSKGGMAVINNMANGLTPKKGVEWPLPEDTPRCMGADDMERLWPDRRAGTGNRRKRCPASAAGTNDEGSQAVLSTSRLVAPRVDIGLQDQLAHDASRELDSNVELCVYELNEDEDPWGRQSDDDL